MTFQARAEEIVNASIEKIEVPHILNGYHKALWVQGRDTAIKHARQIVRHSIGQPLTHLKHAPKSLQKDMGVEGSKFWLEGHEAALKFIEMKLNAFVFNMTGGQILATRLNK